MTKAYQVNNFSNIIFYKYSTKVDPKKHGRHSQKYGANNGIKRQSHLSKLKEPQRAANVPKIHDPPEKRRRMHERENDWRNKKLLKQGDLKIDTGRRRMVTDLKLSNKNGNKTDLSKGHRVKFLPTSFLDYHTQRRPQMLVNQREDDKKLNANMRDRMKLTQNKHKIDNDNHTKHRAHRDALKRNRQSRHQPEDSDKLLRSVSPFQKRNEVQHKNRHRQKPVDPQKGFQERRPKPSPFPNLNFPSRLFP